MSESGKIIGRPKSIRDIETQRRRIEDAMRDAYHNAEKIDSNSERRQELARLNSRMRRVNGIAEVYQDNIREQPEYRRSMEAWGQTLRGNVGREERKAIIDSAQNKKYSRSVRIGRKNNRRE